MGIKLGNGQDTPTLSKNQSLDAPASKSSELGGLPMPVMLGDGVSMMHPLSEALKTGKAMPVRQHPSSIDLSQTDTPAVQAMNAARERAISLMEQDPLYLALLNKPSWSKEERMQWEATLASSIKQAVAEQPLLKDYRTSSKSVLYDRAPSPVSGVKDMKILAEPPPVAPEDWPAYQAAVERVDAAEKYAVSSPKNGDLTHLQPYEEFDCDRMAFIQGMLQTQLEERALSSTVQDGGYKRPHEYYLVGGQQADESALKKGDGFGWHAVIISSATAGVIEATNAPGRLNYLRPASPAYEFADFVAGAPVVAHYFNPRNQATHTNDTYYFVSSSFDLDRYMKRHAAFEAGNISQLNTMVDSDHSKTPAEITIKQGLAFEELRGIAARNGYLLAQDPEIAVDPNPPSFNAPRPLASDAGSHKAPGGR